MTKPPEPLWALRFFPLYHWSQVPVLAVQQALRSLFEQWGLPQRIRVDNGAPWGSWSDLPPALCLWWLGLGVETVWNHPHCPKENAFVERFNGLTDAWGEPQHCPHLAAWQERMDWVVQMQREVYPSVGGKSRREAYPSLGENPRSYCASQEASVWDCTPVYAYLSQGRWARRVSQTGQITLYNQGYSVGRGQAGRQVFVRFDAHDTTWVVLGEDGQEVARHPAQQITAERICSLQVCHVKPSRRKR